MNIKVTSMWPHLRGEVEAGKAMILDERRGHCLSPG